MAPQQDQFSPQSVHFEVGGGYVSAPLVPTEEIGNPTGDPKLLATNREVKVCEGADPCLADNGMIKEEIAFEVIDKNEQLLAPGIDDENDGDNEDGFNNSVEQMEKSLVVEGELMKNSHTPKMPYERLVKQAELIAMIESPSLGLGALNPIGNNGEFKGMNMMVIFYPGRIKPEFSLKAQTNSSVQCVFDYGVLNTSACGSVMKLVGKTPNDYVNPGEVFALEVVVEDGVLIIDTLVRILLVVVVILFVMVWYDREKGGEIGSLTGEYKVLADMRVLDIINSTISLEQGSLTAGDEAVITQIGMSTENGKVHYQIHEASQSEEDKPLRKKLKEFGESSSSDNIEVSSDSILRGLQEDFSKRLGDDREKDGSILEQFIITNQEPQKQHWSPNGVGVVCLLGDKAAQW
nr:calcium-transporting ATPase 4, endoplasmic reticulum-type-like [Ipomoea batatas]